MDSLERIHGMFLRYLYLHRRSVSRALELIFWPVMDLIVWGLVALYIKNVAQGEITEIIFFLVSALIFWDLLYRSQQSVSISFVEDIWTNNILNIFISPLRMREWLIATFLYGLLKVTVITAILGLLAYLFYHFNIIDELGLLLFPLAFNLLFFGWSLGVFTAGLLLRFGNAVQALIWGIPFLIQPLSAIYYPLSTLPEWAQVIAKAIPTSYVFESMRYVLKEGVMPWNDFFISVFLNFIYFILFSLAFYFMYLKSRESGRLGRIGMD